MTITIKQGDIFLSNADILVNPVNCQGVMGAGLALQFKERYPDMYTHYRDLFQNRILNLGRVYFYPEPSGKKIIVLFPTKFNWRDESQLEWISEGLDDLVRILKGKAYFGDKIALPALGCGLGGLLWRNVKPLMIQKLKGLSKITNEVVIYEPNEM